MLKELQKALGIKPKAEEGAGLVVKLNTEDIQAAIDAAIAELRVEFDAFKQTAEELAAHEQEVIAAMAAELDATKAALVEAQAALTAATAEKTAAEAAALATKLAVRKEKLVASIGTERADALLKVTEGMDDAAFEAVVSALGVSAAVEAASPLFQEVGAEGKANAAKVTEESPEMKILKKKYAKSK